MTVITPKELEDINGLAEDFQNWRVGFDKHTKILTQIARLRHTFDEIVKIVEEQGRDTLTYDPVWDTGPRI